MSQTNPFTQAASQGYGDFAPTLDEEEEQEEEQGEEQGEEQDGPQSPEPEDEQLNELGFTQTQERSYPTGDIESPDEDENDQNEPQSPSPDEDEQPINVKQSQQRRRVQIMNDSDNEDEHQIESRDNSQKEQRKRQTDEHENEKKSKRFRETSNDDEDQHVDATSDVEDVVDNIFGKGMNEDEDENNDDREEAAAELADLNDNEGFQEEEDEDQQRQQETFDAEEDDEPSTRKEHYTSSKNSINYDIDLYLEKKAEKRRGQRRRGKGDSIDISDPGADQIASKFVEQMNIATEEDRIFNKNRKPATAKLLLLPKVEQLLCRADLAETFLDHGILTVFKDWLSPLPDKSLPNIKIRQALIKILQQFGIIDAEKLRDSGIGKALMFLYKHPRETKENKFKLIKIIHEWARPIFNLDTDYKLLTREERQQRDADQASLKRQTSLTGKPKNRSVDVDLPFASKRRNNDDDDDESNKDDDCPRARVPRLSNRDYVVRPVSTVEYSDKKGEGKKKSVSRIDEIRRRQQDRKRLSKPMSIVKLSIEGNKMHL